MPASKVTVALERSATLRNLVQRALDEALEDLSIEVIDIGKDREILAYRLNATKEEGS